MMDMLGLMWSSVSCSNLFLIMGMALPTGTDVDKALTS